MKKLILFSVVVLSCIFPVMLDYNKAHGDDTAILNQTINSLNPLPDNTLPRLPAFYPIFLIIMLFCFMSFALRNRHDKEKLAIPFSIASLIVCILLTFIFNAPIAYDIQGTQTKMTITVYPNGTTKELSVDKTFDEFVLIPNDKQFRVIFQALFEVLALFNGLLTILIVTSWGRNKNKTN